jgi:hypothetical protein
MVDFDVAAGGSQDVFNSVLKQVYPILYKWKLLTQTIHIGQLGIDSAKFDILEPPTVDFKVIILSNTLW